MFAYCGFRIRAPLTLHQLTVAAGALAEGWPFGSGWTSPAWARSTDRPARGGIQPWTLFGLALVAWSSNSSSPIPEWKAGGGLSEAASVPDSCPDRRLGVDLLGGERPGGQTVDQQVTVNEVLNLYCCGVPAPRSPANAAV